MRTIGQGRALRLTAMLAVMIASGCGGGGGVDTSGVGVDTSGVPATPVALLSCTASSDHGVTDTQTTPAPKARPTNLPLAIDAYASQTSVKQGEPISFHLSDHSGSADRDGTADYSIARVGLNDRIVASGSVPVRKHPVPDDAWINCCDWPVGMTVLPGTDWPPGLYQAKFTTPSSGLSALLYFVVKSAQPGTESPVVLQVPFHTAHAYNNWGGKSAYGFNSTNGSAASRLSLNRPMRPSSMDAEVHQYIRPLIRWAETQGIELAYISGDDMHATPGVLSAYKMFVTVGHDEYWSLPMRTELERFVAAGGNSVILSGNTMWWRIDFGADRLGRAVGVMEVTKSAGTNSYLWHAYAPEGGLILSSFVRGGQVPSGKPELGRFGYRVQQAGHWVFEGSGATAGSAFGGEHRMHSYESDGIDFTYDSLGMPRATGGDGAPTDTKILALARLDGWTPAGRTVPTHLNLTGEPGVWAAMTLHESANRGTLFNAGTTHWVNSLAPCTGAAGTSTACQVTKNLFDRLKRSQLPEQTQERAAAAASPTSTSNVTPIVLQTVIFVPQMAPIPVRAPAGSSESAIGPTPPATSNACKAG